MALKFLFKKKVSLRFYILSLINNNKEQEISCVYPKRVSYILQMPGWVAEMEK